MSTFPTLRLRRLRRTPQLRNWVAQTHLSVDDLIYPIFVSDEPGAREPIASMPGVYQLSVDNTVIEVANALALGIQKVLLFGVSHEKDREGTAAWVDHGIVQQAIRAIKNQFRNDVLVMADTCLCDYTSHGHCGMVLDNQVLNDPSLELLGRIAVSQAQAGADVVAPSAMMDGQVGAIRHALDSAGFDGVPIMAYSAKFASALYGPFRDAAQSAPSFGDRRGYQMDYRNSNEALEEMAQDVAEGADLIMVKPALAYMDIIRMAREITGRPLVVYNVSGEYSMVKAAAMQGWLDEKAVVMELLTSMKRAGAQSIITYHALDVARWLKTSATA